MRKRMSAIVIDAHKNEHDYSTVKTNFGKFFENIFDIKVVSSSDDFLKELNEFKGFDSIITIGLDINFEPLNSMPFEFRKKWVHFNEFNAQAIAGAITATFKMNITRDNEDSQLFSIFTCTFNTPKPFINRLYKSLCSQTYKNWNWWILDDSKDEETVKYISGLNDPRIIIIRNYTNHGSIGFNKHVIASAANGDYLVEVDHDDELTTNCLERLKAAFDKYPDCGFVYSYAMEEMDGKPVLYDKGFALGLGKYEEHDVNGKTYNVAITPDVNALSVRHIVGLPNHVRCWKKDIYHNLNGHNIELSVLDDMELLIRTFLTTKICKIPEVLYIQHEGTEKTGNTRGTTTQGERLKEIGRVGFFLKEVFDEPIHDKLLSLGIEDAVWKVDEIGGYSDLFDNTIDRESLKFANYILEKEA